MSEAGLVLGGLFIVVGTILWWTGVLARRGLLRRNPFVGIRLPFAVRDHASWAEAHRAAAGSFLWSGRLAIGMAVGMLLVPSEAAAVGLALAASAAVLVLVARGVALARQAVGKF